MIPNPWDAGSARVLAGLGFEALATSSSAAAAKSGRRDGKLTRDEALASARAIVDATDLPVAGDLESGFGQSPDAAAETVRLAAQTGLVAATSEAKQSGTFGFLDKTLTSAELNNFLPE